MIPIIHVLTQVKDIDTDLSYSKTTDPDMALGSGTCLGATTALVASQVTQISKATGMAQFLDTDMFQTDQSDHGPPHGPV